jgi:glycosyltransferase involved in cell wall biosynthesis
VARAAAGEEALAAFFTTLYGASFSPLVDRLPWAAFRGPLRKGLAARSFVGIPRESVKSVGVGAETTHLLARRLSGQHALASRRMYAAKAVFDRRVAGVLSHSGGPVLAVYASARETLAKANDAGRFAVLNFVNSHPADHNRYLRELGGVPAKHHELVPVEVAARVEEELASADLVLVPSTFVAAQLERIGLPGTKIALEPYGVDPTAFAPAPRDVEPARNDAVRCLFVGQISHRKGLRFLLEAARRLSSLLTIELVGPMISPEVLATAPSNVRWRGSSSSSDLPSLFRSADIFVLPSLEDSFGLVALEAMSSGLPVVISDHAGASELVEHEMTGLLVPAGDSNELTGALRRLAEDRELGLRLGREARKAVARGPTWEEYGRRVVTRCLCSPAPPTSVRAPGGATPPVAVPGTGWRSARRLWPTTLRGLPGEVIPVRLCEKDLP